MAVLKPEYCTAITALHIFTRCDSTSVSKGIGKLKHIKMLQTYARFQSILYALVEEWQVTPNLLAGLEEFTCAMYMYGRRQLKDVNVLAIHAHQGEVWVTRWVYKS